MRFMLTFKLFTLFNMLSLQYYLKNTFDTSGIFNV